MFLQLLHKVERKGTLPYTFYEVSITLIKQKKDDDMRKKENYSPISLTNVDTKFLNKIFARQIQQYIKEIIQFNQVNFISEMQG
jgi:hypothetical protein